jgi:hypothetical protein
VVGIRNTVAALAAAAVLVAGCSDTTKGTPAPASDTSAVDVYVSAVRNLYPPTVTEAELVRLGRTICRGLRAGLSWEDEVAAVAAGAGGGAGRQVRAAVAAFCPEYTP